MDAWPLPSPAQSLLETGSSTVQSWVDEALVGPYSLPMELLAA